MLSNILLAQVYFILICFTPGQPLSIALILKANYSTGTSFQQITVTTPNTCMCACINHPHCLSISVTETTSNTALISNTGTISSTGKIQTFYCQLFATYPALSSDLSLSSIGNVTVLVDRTLSSVYTNNSTKLSNPSKLFVDNTEPWTPVFKLFTGNNQNFLWINSTNSTTLTPIPSIPVNQPDPHWYSVLIANWTQGTYKPGQVAVAFIVNRSVIIEFLIFNASQTNMTSWFAMTQLVSNQFWPILTYQNYAASINVKALYIDSVCTRSFNCNYKSSTTSCSGDFYGYFLVHGGYTDECIAAATPISSVRIPSIFYNPSTVVSNGNFSYFSVADGLMIFVR